MKLQKGDYIIFKEGVGPYLIDDKSHPPLFFGLVVKTALTYFGIKILNGAGYGFKSGQVYAFPFDTLDKAACIGRAKNYKNYKNNKATLKRIKEMDQVRIMESVIQKLGKNHQIGKAIEEFEELLVELKKWKKGDEKNLDELITDEMADAVIMWNQLLLIFDNSSEVEARIDFKLKRLKERLNNLSEK